MRIPCARRFPACSWFVAWSSFLRYSCSLLLLSLLLRLIPISCFSLFPLSFRPTPSSWLFSTCLLKLSPAPGAWDVRTGDRFAVAGGAVICLLLIVSCRSLRLRSFAFVLPAVRVFFSCFVFPCLLGRVSLSVVGARPRFSPCSPSRAFPASSLLSPPSSLINPVRSSRRLCLCSSVLASVLPLGRVIPSVRFLASPPSVSAFRLLPGSASRLLPAWLASVPSFRRVSPPFRLGRRPACFAHLGFVAVLLSCGLAPFRPSPRIACRGRGGLLCRGSLSSRVARCFEFRSPWSLVSPCARPPVVLACFPCLGIVRDGGGCRCGWGLVVRACLLRAACLPRLGSCVGGVDALHLRVACPRYANRPAPTI